MTTLQNHKRTRLGKVVGAYKMPLQSFVYWPEKNWITQEPGFHVVAPSGARKTWHATEAEARDEVARQNEQWA